MCNFATMEKKNFLRFVIVATAIFLVVLLVKKDSVLRWVQTGFELRRQRKEIEYYEKQIRDLDSRIEGLSTNRDTLEAYAREQFLFSEPGDDVYLEP